MQYPDITAGRMHGSNAYEREQKMWEAFQRGVQENNALAADAFRRWQERDDAIKAEERAREAEWAKMQELYRQQVAEREGGQRYKTSEREASQVWQSGEIQKGREFTESENKLNRTSQETIAKGHDEATKYSADKAYEATVYGVQARNFALSPAGQASSYDSSVIERDDKGNPITDYGVGRFKKGKGVDFAKLQQQAQQNPNHTGPNGLYSSGGSHDVNAPLRSPNEPGFVNPIPGQDRLAIP